MCAFDAFTMAIYRPSVPTHPGICPKYICTRYIQQECVRRARVCAGKNDAGARNKKTGRGSDGVTVPSDRADRRAGQNKSGVVVKTPLNIITIIITTTTTLAYYINILR